VFAAVAEKKFIGLCAAKVLTFLAVELVVGAGAGPVDEALWVDSIVCLTNAGNGLFSVDRLGKQAGADPTVQYVFVWRGRGIGVEQILVAEERYSGRGPRDALGKPA